MFRKAILIIHGFAGGTYDQEVLATKLELNWRYDVFNFTLPGHDVRLKKNATKDKWIESSEEHLKTLIDAGYKNIYLIGHSMGGVIATYLASKYKEVTKLVLAAPAFRYVTNENGKFELLDALKKTPDLLKTYSKNEIVARMLKLPIPALTEFANLVKEQGCFVNLFGEIGAGKTAFVKLVAEALGIKEKVTSPSFVILNEYHSASIPVYHFDLYRLEHTGISTITEELREYSEGKKITFVEWAEFSQGELPFERIEINVTYDDDDSRIYEFKSIGEKNKYITEGLKA
jgi:tRNA threonylcarbamoyladenosine biosynthesis protein TsaE